MKKAGWLIALSKDRWRLARVLGEDVQVKEVAVAAGKPVAEVAREAARLLKESGYAGEGICLGLESSEVFSARIDVSDVPAKGYSGVMLFRLEEQLPLDAEKIAADFLPAVGGRRLGVATEIAPVKEVVEALAASGVEVACIAPAALLAVWVSTRGEAKPSDFALVTEGAGADIFRMMEGAPVAWHSGLASPEEMARCVDAEILESPVEGRPVRVCLIGRPDASVIRAREEGPRAEVSTHGHEEPIILAARAAERLLSGEPAGWLDLRRGGLAPSSAWARVAGLVKAVTVLAIIALAALAAAFFWRSFQYESAARGTVRKEVDEYVRLFPNQAVPVDVKSRMESEFKRRAGLCGAGLDSPDRASALDTLRQATAALPASVRLRVVEMRIDSGDLFIEGQAQTHTDAELVTRALKNGGFDVGSPRSEGLADGGVSFRIYGKAASPAPAADAKGAAR